jgi:esterase/lipase superfamily enzyme
MLSLLVGVAALCASCAGSWGAASRGSAADQLFLTNREAGLDRDGGVRFGNDAGATTAGRCVLRVPADPEAEPVVERIEAIERAALLAALDAGVDAGVTLYVHGYNIGLGRACREAAVFARRTGQEDRLLLFSWPASRTILTYPRDAAQFDASKPALADVLGELGRRYGRDHVNVVAHSMGARVIDAVVSELEAGEDRFANLVLVAPDVDQDRFLELLPGLRRRVRDITVLVSERDRLLLLSETVHLAERLGRTDGIDVQGVEVIDVTDLGDAGLGGHLYHLTNASVGRAIGVILDGR